MNDLELYHYGIKGMKWGVRKSRSRSNLLQNIKRKRSERIANEEKNAN